jgi:hypothetical protein
VKTYILVAGVPARFREPLQKSLGIAERGDSGFRPIIVPLSEYHPTDYSRGYVRSVVARLARDVLNHPEQQTCLVVYLDHTSSDLLCEAVYRFALLVAVSPPHGEELRFDREGQTINRLTADIRRAYSHFGDVVRAVGSEVDSGRRNRTPLLLPSQNFASQHLDQLLRTLSCKLVPTKSQEAAQAEIGRVVSDFLRHHPMVQPERGKKAHSNGVLIFNSPGTDLHGKQHAPERHPDECIIGARVRLGHYFHHRFHYDVEPHHGSFGTVLPSCHGSFDVPHGSAYVNIAPNDHVRGKAE